MKRKHKNEKATSAKDEHLESNSSDVSARLEPEFPQVSKVSLNESMTCPNLKCGKAFDKPLELIDLAKPSAESSYVCPYCLSKIEPIQPEQETVVVVGALPEENLPGATKQEEGKCPHFVGYLGKRPKNTPIPDFCLTCPEMMKCILK